MFSYTYTYICNNHFLFPLSLPPVIGPPLVDFAFATRIYNIIDKPRTCRYFPIERTEKPNSPSGFTGVAYNSGSFFPTLVSQSEECRFSIQANGQLSVLPFSRSPVLPFSLMRIKMHFRVYSRFYASFPLRRALPRLICQRYCNIAGNAIAMNNLSQIPLHSIRAGQWWCIDCNTNVACRAMQILPTHASQARRGIDRKNSIAIFSSKSGSKSDCRR